MGIPLKANGLNDIDLTPEYSMKNIFTFFLSFSFSLLAQNKDTETGLNAELSAQFIKDSIAYTTFEKENGKYIQTPNVKMHYLEWGNPNHPTLVWVHGSYSNGTEITGIIDALVKNGLHVIAIDYYGHGKTPIPQKEVSLYNVADDIKWLLDSKKIKSTYIAGWSRGGSIATAFYDAYSEMVKGIILVDGGAANWIRKRQLLSEETLNAAFAQNDKDYFSSLRELYKANYSADDPQWNVYNFSFFGKEKKGWTRNPYLQEWLEDDTVELQKRQFYKPTTSSLFNQSTTLMLPEIIYRNLKTKMLIIDPTKDDAGGFFAYSEEYEKIKALHPKLVTISQYPNATHGVIFQEPTKLQNDIIDFLKSL